MALCFDAAVLLREFYDSSGWVILWCLDCRTYTIFLSVNRIDISYGIVAFCAWKGGDLSSGCTLYFGSSGGEKTSDGFVGSDDKK